MASRLLGAVNISLCKSFLAAEPFVELERGGFITNRGTSTGPVEHFQNITYGHDTSGIRRSAPPKPCLAPEGKEVSSMPQHQAQHAPSFRAQYHSSSPRCPKLARAVSICAFARPKAPRRMIKLPVVVHIFTGGLTRASAEDIHWDLGNFITLSISLGKFIINVAFNFRLTLFGCARLPLLKEQRSLNLGMRDQRAGLQCVKNNIATFGGDPDLITAFRLKC